MYVTAQHVLAPASQREGVNAFLYLHGDIPWGEPPAPEDDPGELHSKLVSVDPPGNRVRSFLDIVAPDTMSPTRIRESFAQFLEASQGAPLPWSMRIGHCLIRFGVEGALEPTWQDELADLFAMTETIRRY